MTCQHGENQKSCQRPTTKVPIIYIGSKDPSQMGIHITFAVLMACDQHAQAITIEDILDAEGWTKIQIECGRKNIKPDIKTLGFHFAPIEKVIEEVQGDMKNGENHNG